MSGEESTARPSELTPTESDAVREIGSILMGAAATAISEMVNQRVDVSVPVLRQISWDELEELYPYPCFLVQVGFRQGFTGEGQLVLGEPDARLLAHLLLQRFTGEGEETGEPQAGQGGGLTEMETSALAEAMNQMMGASATALSTLLAKRVNIVPPRSTRVEQGKLVAAVQATIGGEAGDHVVVVLCDFHLEHGPGFNMGLLLPLALGRSMVADLLGPDAATQREKRVAIDSSTVPAGKGEAVLPTSEVSPETRSNVASTGSLTSSSSPPSSSSSSSPSSSSALSRVSAPPAAPTPVLPVAHAERGRHRRVKSGAGKAVRENGEKRRAREREEGQALASEAMPAANRPGDLGNLSIELIRSVPVELDVRVGSVVLPMHTVMHLGAGGVIAFAQSVREPVEVLANGRLVAYGQVVEVDGNYAVRITQLATSQERLAALRRSG
ncbi:MAG: chemotaxis protein CheC [Limnochordaceae bacterium]|nr:chemotaxis protein CheC [Limnochordaceae bacterium]